MQLRLKMLSSANAFEISDISRNETGGAIRIDVARRRLEETTDRIETVAEHSGFSGEEQMRSTFIRTLGIPPREYRKRFASTATLK
ncbi:MAG TPA: helix-turn-helix domain-containing protein [Candidatus Binatia bacterium]|nr:helix-turn-helix domain-containing protein [Candidatus Binatia bacterium]